MASPLKKATLTKRQAEVARCLAQELSKRQIADKLFVEYGTVRIHCRNISKKWEMETESTAALQVEAQRRGYHLEQE